MNLCSGTTLVDLSEPSPEAIALLHRCGARARPHSGRTLFDHLLGTYGLLRAWGNPEPVCLGGLFHSIYGTNAFRHQSLPESKRLLLQALIGMEAEALAWWFCHIDRPRAILAALEDAQQIQQKSQSVQPDQPNWVALAEIEVANLIEQGDIGRSSRDLYCLSIERPEILTSTARTALKSCLAQRLSVRQSAHPSATASSSTMATGKIAKHRVGGHA